MGENISIQETANLLRQGAKLFRFLEKGHELAERVIALDQDIAQREKRIETLKNDEVVAQAAANAAVDRQAEQETIAKDIVPAAERQAAAIVQKAKDEAQTALDEAGDELASVKVEIAEETEKLNALTAAIAEKQTTLDNINQEIEAARARFAKL